MPEPRTVVLVGHCGPDEWMLKAAIRRMAPKVELRIQSADDDATIEQFLNPESLFLINRMLDGDFSTESGIDFITEIAGRSEHPAMMLISDFPDAQQAAIAAGALPGFGKSQLYNEASAAKLRHALGM